MTCDIVFDLDFPSANNNYFSQLVKYNIIKIVNDE